MNILYVAHERNLGGATRSLIAMTSEMTKRGHNAYAITPLKTAKVTQELNALGIPTKSTFFAWWQMPKDWNLLYKLLFRCLYMIEFIQVEYMYRYYKHKNIDIVHSNSSVIDFGYKLSKRLGCKHVWHFREFGDADYNLEYMWGKDKSLCVVNNKGGEIIFISRSLYDCYKEYVKNKVNIVYNGIDSQYYMERSYEKKEKIIFLTTANLHRNKNQKIILEAGKKLLDSNIANFEIWIAGTSSAMEESKKYEIELKEYASCNLDGRAKFLGSISQMNEIRKAADIEIVPSIREAFGRVTIEAMLGGMPVIASNAGANVELVEDTKSGLLFKNNDIGDLANKMKFFIDNFNCIEEMGRFAQREARKKFTSVNNALEIEQVYYR